METQITFNQQQARYTREGEIMSTTLRAEILNGPFAGCVGTVTEAEDGELEVTVLVDARKYIAYFGTESEVPVKFTRDDVKILSEQPK